MKFENVQPRKEKDFLVDGKFQNRSYEIYSINGRFEVVPFTNSNERVMQMAFGDPVIITVAG